jgi:GT2 family glycosyltransferase
LDNLTAIIPFRNGHTTIERLLDSIPPTLPIIVVDDQSDEPYHSVRPNVTVIRPDARGYFSGAVNAGLDACQTDVLVLNQDVVLSGTAWLDMLAEKRSTYAVIGDGVFSHPAWPQGYVQGTFMFMRRDAVAAVGGLNAEEYPLWGSTAEWQLRACRQGFEAFPLKNIPGFSHSRQGSFGSSIQQALHDEPDRKALFVQTPPKVSVIISCYNYGRYLTDAVRSLIGGETDLGYMPGQTYHSFEIIIVNDASQDETREVGQYLADDWQAIRYIELPPANHRDGLPNNGTPAANNAGIQAAYGRYVTILCADDMMEPWRLSHFVAAQESNPHSLIFDNTMEFADGQRTTTRPYGPYDFELLLKKNFIHAGIMFPRAAWEEVGGYPEVMRYGREDWAMNVRLGLHGYCGVWLPEGGYLYRNEGQGRHYRNTTPGWRERFTEQMYNLFPRLYLGERPEMCCGKDIVKSNSNGSAPAGQQRNAVMVGQEGMEILEYTGGNLATQLWAGMVTGTDYEFGGSRKRAYVDARDAHGQGNKKGMPELYGVFRIVPPDTITEEDAELEVAPNTAETINPTVEPDTEEDDGETAETGTATSQVTVVEDVPDVTALSVSKLQALIATGDLTPTMLASMRKAEKAGANRKTAVAALEAALEAETA